MHYCLIIITEKTFCNDSRDVHWNPPYEPVTSHCNSALYFTIEQVHDDTVYVHSEASKPQVQSTIDTVYSMVNGDLWNHHLQRQVYNDAFTVSLQKMYSSGTSLIRISKL